MTEEDFAELLENHDWWYSMSDDPRTFTRGLAELEQIKAIAKSDPVLNDMYMEKARSVFQTSIK